MTFGKLDKNTMLKIVGKFLVILKDMLKEKDVSVTITDEAIDQLVEQGFDSKMGARPLQRIIDKELKTPLSKMLLFGNLKDGGVLNIDYKDEKYILNTEVKEKIADEV
jgi:ATP-dependent Clp protease ATP-binding subunit ClpA